VAATACRRGCRWRAIFGASSESPSTMLGQAVPYPLWIKASGRRGVPALALPEKSTGIRKTPLGNLSQPQDSLEYIQGCAPPNWSIMKRSSASCSRWTASKRVRSVSLFRLQSPGLARRALWLFLWMGIHILLVASSSGRDFKQKLRSWRTSCPTFSAVASIGSFHPHALSVRCHRLDGQI